MMLGEYAKSIRPLPVNAITTENVLTVLRPLWHAKPETASRVGQRIEAVLDAAKAQGHRLGDNPARWRGHLDKLLPPAKKLSRGHHAAMPFREVPGFVAKLRESPTTSNLALEFAVLTATRSGEVIGATWSEIDLQRGLWTVPAHRMKAGREHQVPLTSRMVEILEALPERAGLLFPGAKPGKPLSVMALAMALRRAGRGDVTVHGFRSAFRDWCGDETSFPRELAESALAHAIKDSTERAYRRSNALEKRRDLMAAWNSFLHDSGAEVIHLATHKRPVNNSEALLMA